MKVVLKNKFGNEKKHISFRVETEEIINREAGTTILLAYPDPLLAFDLAKRVYRGIDYFIPKDSLFNDSLLMPSRVVVVARCAEGDKFDLETGRDIVRKKMEKKLREAVVSRFRNIANEFRRTADDLAGYLE